MDNFFITNFCVEGNCRALAWQFPSTRISECLRLTPIRIVALIRTRTLTCPYFLWIIGGVLFGYVYWNNMQLANPSRSTNQPSFQSIIYTPDLLFPVTNLKLRDVWIATGAAQWWSMIFIILKYFCTCPLIDPSARTMIKK